MLPTSIYKLRGQQQEVVRSLSVPVMEFSEVLSCSLSLSTSSGWTCSYRVLPNHSAWGWFSTGATESDT